MAGKAGRTQILFDRSLVAEADYVPNLALELAASTL